MFRMVSWFNGAFLMSFYEMQIKEFGEARNQHAILVFTNQNPRWILVDKLSCTIDSLAQGLL